MTNSRQKGKRIEREAASYLTALGFRAARTAQCRGKNNGAADIDCPSLPNIHIEVKGDESIQVGSATWHAAIRQASTECGDKSWVVLWRRKALPWCLTFALDGGAHIVTTTGDASIRISLTRLNARSM